jgi:hypothetical protein
MKCLVELGSKLYTFHTIFTVTAKGFVCARTQVAPATPAARLAARRDKKGNPLEFLQLLISLTKRW